MKILVSYRGIPQSHGWATGDMVLKAFKDMGHEAYPYGNYYQRPDRLGGLTIRDTVSHDYDLYLQMECGDGDPFYSEVTKYIRTRKVASWWFDVALYPQKWLSETAYIKPDINFVANVNFLDKNTNCIYLPYAACNSNHFREIVEKDKDIDFLIIGSDRPERRRLFEILRQAVPCARVEYVTNSFRYEYIYALSRSKFVINDIAGGGSGLLPMRPFETIAAGSNLITPKDDGCKKLGIPCIEYTDEADLLRICTALNLTSNFSNPALQKEFMRHNTYNSRCQTILDTIFNERI